jgi:pilus assembly protein CpaE
MADSPNKIRLVVVDDNSDTLNNLRKLLYFEKDIEIIGTASSGDEAIKVATQHQPDVVLMDINMPGMDGISASEAITARTPSVQIVIMSVQAEADYLRRAMLAGAREFLIKPFSSEQLANTVRAVYQLGAGQRATNRIAAAAATSAPAMSATMAAPVSALPAPASAPAADRFPPAPQSYTPPRMAAPPAPLSKSGQPPPVAEGERFGKILVVYSANGGIGRSTVAVNLAIALREETRAKVALVDASLHFGDVGVLLNLNSNHTIADVCSADGGVDTEIVADILATHPSGIKVLLGPRSPEMAELCTGPAIRQVLSTLKEKFDYIVVDTYNTLDDIVLGMLDLSDQILLLSTSEIPSIKNTKLFFEVTEALNYLPEKTQLILNKFDPKSTISAQDIQASIKHPVYAIIERDDRAAVQAVQTGQPFIVNQRSAPVTAAVVRLARLLTRPAAEPADAAAAQRKRLFR